MRCSLPSNPLSLFLLMLVLALVFGLCSYNLFFLLSANIGLIYENGAMALRDGALEQLFYLTLYGVVSLASYLLLKACEKLLVEWLTAK